MAHPPLSPPARRERAVGRRAPLLLAIASCLASAAPAEAQIVEGTVLDAGSGEPVATARVTLVAEGDDDRVATALSDGEGRFVLQADAGGLHRLEADRLGYGLQRTDPFEVEADGITEHDFPLATEAVEVEGIVVEGYAGGLLHQDDMAGVYARRARSPEVGSNRVLVRGDPDLDSQWRVKDVLPLSIPRRQCPRMSADGERIPFMYWDGRIASVIGHDAEAYILDLPVREVAAIEYYLDINSAPMPLRPDERYRLGIGIGMDVIRACGIVGVWSRGAPR